MLLFFVVVENPLACGCEQQEIWAWLRDHQRLGAGQLRCDQPPQLRGQLFLELSATTLCGTPLLVKLAIQDIQPYSFVVSWQSRNHSGLHGFQVAYSNQDQFEPVNIRGLVGSFTLDSPLIPLGIFVLHF